MVMGVRSFAATVCFWETRLRIGDACNPDPPGAENDFLTGFHASSLFRSLYQVHTASDITRTSGQLA